MRNFRPIRFFLVLGMVLTLMRGVTAQSSVPVHPGMDTVNISAHVLGYVPAGSRLDDPGDVPDSLWKPFAEVFERQNQKKKGTSPFFWRVSLTNAGSDTVKVIILMPLCSRADLHDGESIKKAGLEVPADVREFRFLEMAMSAAIPPHSTKPLWGTIHFGRYHIYLKKPRFYAGEYERFTGQFLVSKSLELDHKFLLLFDGFIFVVGVMFLFMLAQYVQIRDDIYLYYVGYLGLVFLYFISTYEMTCVLSLPFTKWITYRELRYPAGLLVNVAYYYFVANVLDIKRKIPWLHKLFTGFIYYFYLTTIAVIILGPVLHLYSYESFVYRVARISWFLPSLVFVFVIWRIPMRFGRIILWGTLILLFGTIISMYLTFTVRSYSSYWQYPIIYTMFGVMIEMLFFSVAVGLKARENARERLAAKEALIHQLEENEKLQKEVEERLKEEVRMQQLKSEQRKTELEKKRAESQNHYLKLQLAEMELKALRGQMNPHFVFNTLNSIKSYILRKGPLEAAEYLTNFANLIRAILNNSKQSVISLKDELETLLLYIKLEQMRFPERFEFVFLQKTGQSLENIVVPPLILQPYVENAIWHGLLHLDKKGFLRIEVSQDEDSGCIHVIIEDNGIGREKAEELKKQSGRKYKSMGMGITQERIGLYNLLANRGIKVEVFDAMPGEENTGTIVKITLSCDKAARKNKKPQNR